MTHSIVYWGGPVFDGHTMRHGHAVCTENGQVTAIGPAGQIGTNACKIDLQGDILAPGFVDLQVNGGGGVLFNDAPSVETLQIMAAAHRRLGATTIFPTFITDAPGRNHLAVEAVAKACACGVAGIGGLHLEGPHIAASRNGAHHPDFIRPMEAADLDFLIDAAARLPALMVTLAPEAATTGQVRRLAAAGAIISLGHSNADFDTCLAYAAAGAACVTHLFNAMSQIGHRAPGLAGAAIACGGLSAGLIADGFHVHPEALRIAATAKRGPGELFLVSDAMSPAATEITHFELNGRRVQRRNGRLTLDDGMLAGADLDLVTAIRIMVERAACSPEQALAMATSIPARIGRQPVGVGTLRPGAGGRLIRLSANLDAVQPLQAAPIALNA